MCHLGSKLLTILTTCISNLYAFYANCDICILEIIDIMYDFYGIKLVLLSLHLKNTLESVLYNEDATRFIRNTV